MSDTIKIDELIGLEEAAKWLGLSVQRLGDMARNKKIPAVKIGVKWAFCKHKIEKFYSDKMDAVGEQKSES